MSSLKSCAVVFLLLVFVSPAIRAQPPAAPKPTPEVQALLDQAKAARESNKLAESEPLSQQALDKARAAQDKPGEVLALLEYAALSLRTNKFEKAMESAQQALTLSKILADKNGEALALLKVGTVHYSMGKPLDALEPFQQAAALFHEAGDRFDEAGCLMNVGIVYENTGQVKKALTLYESVLPIFRELGKKKGEANTLTNIALANEKLGEPRKAMVYLRQALPLYREIKDLPNIANVLIITAGHEINIGSTMEALKLAQEALSISREAKSARQEALALAEIGSVYMRLNRDTQALDYLGRALEIQKTTRAGMGDTLSKLGILYSRMGDAGKAQEYLQQTLEIYRQMGNKHGVVDAQLNLGYAFSDLRRYSQAEAYFHAAQPDAEALGDRRLVASVYNGLGSIARNREQYTTALTLLHKAADIYQTLDEPQHLASIWSNIGNAYQDQGDWKQAEAAQRKALALFTKIKDNHGISNIMFALADIYHKTKRDPKQAEQWYRGAITAGQKANNRVYTANAFYGLARLEKEQGKLAQAETHSAQAIDLVEQVRTRIGESGEGKSEFLSANLYHYYAHLEILLARGKAADAFQFAQLTKARTLLDTLANGRVDLSSVLTPEEKQQEEALRLQSDSLNQQMVREGVENEVGAKKRYAALKVQLKQTERQLQVFTEALYARHPALARRRVAQTATLAEMAKIVPADTALLDYAAVSSKEWCVFVVTTQQGKPQVRAVRLQVPYDRLARDAAAFRKACADPRKSWEPQARTLYAALIRPLEAALVGKTRLIVCPDGALWDVPFAALLKAGTPLWSRYAISYAYSATGWQASRTLAQERRRVQAPKSLLVLANPDFGSTKRFGGLAELPGQRPLSEPSRRFAQPSRPLSEPSRPISDPSRPISEPSRSLSAQIASTVPTRGGVIVSLAGTRREADSLKALFPDAELLTEKQAQESTIKAEAGNFRYLHFATHGFLNDAAPMLSSVVLAVPTADSKEDGFLTAREIYELHLQAELAVLSACNTGRGEARSGEGIVGLTWALLCAGCPSQVVSLWSVDDATTAQLMRGFYSALKAGKDKAESLRSASLELRRNAKHRHPYYWAAFVLMGDSGKRH